MGVVFCESKAIATILSFAVPNHTEPKYTILNEEEEYLLIIFFSTLEFALDLPYYLQPKNLNQRNVFNFSATTIFLIHYLRRLT